jgi:hypothetical protein
MPADGDSIGKENINPLRWGARKKPYVTVMMRLVCEPSLMFTMSGALAIPWFTMDDISEELYMRCVMFQH